MQNQIEEKEALNAKGVVLLLGALFGGLVSVVACGTFSGVLAGAAVGFALAIGFNIVALPHKPHDR